MASTPWLVGRFTIDDHTDARREELAAWIRGLGVDPTNMALRAVVVQRGERYELHLTEHVLDETGRKQLDLAADVPYRRPVVVPVAEGSWPDWLTGMGVVRQTPASAPV